MFFTSWWWQELNKILFQKKKRYNINSSTVKVGTLRTDFVQRIRYRKKAPLNKTASSLQFLAMGIEGRAKYTRARARNYEEMRCEGSAENLIFGAPLASRLLEISRPCVHFVHPKIFIAIAKVRDYSQSTTQHTAFITLNSYTTRFQSHHFVQRNKQHDWKMRLRYCSIAFIWMNTLKDFIPKLKS